MYRVELKVKIPLSEFFRGFVVPNVPCGVESWARSHTPKSCPPVPNVPCGVESVAFFFWVKNGYNTFLMYRVELKAICSFLAYTNVRFMFLMYRVELKAYLGFFTLLGLGMFLMYRVELKELHILCIVRLCYDACS